MKKLDPDPTQTPVKWYLLCSGILDKIQKEFNANDAMMGLLQTAFIVSYTFFAPIFGYLGMARHPVGINLT